MAISTSTERKARRTLVRVSINGHDATAYIAPSLLDFTYTDNISGKADEVQLSLQDREARWNGPWKPQKGMQVEASLTVKDWFAHGEDATLHCGSFKMVAIFSFFHSHTLLKLLRGQVMNTHKQKFLNKAGASYALVYHHSLAPTCRQPVSLSGGPWGQCCVAFVFGACALGYSGKYLYKGDRYARYGANELAFIYRLFVYTLLQFFQFHLPYSFGLSSVVDQQAASTISTRSAGQQYVLWPLAVHHAFVGKHKIPLAPIAALLPFLPSEVSHV